MSVATQEDHTLHAFFPEDQVNNPAAFEAARLEAYRQSLQGQTDAYVALSERTTVTSTGESLAEAALNQALGAAPGETPAQRLARIERAGSRVLEVVLGGDGSVAGLYRRAFVATDPRDVARVRRQADQVPFGPKMNGTSFRTTPGRK